MFSVFSNYLQPVLKANVHNLTEPTKPSELYNYLRIAYNQGAKGIIDCIRFVVPNPGEDESDDYIYEEILSNVELRRIIQWVNKKILLEFNTITFPTIGVRLRIVSGMLNKLVEGNKLNKDIGIYIHSHLSENVLSAYYELATEDLPF